MSQIALVSPVEMPTQNADRSKTNHKTPDGEDEANSFDALYDDASVEDVVQKAGMKPEAVSEPEVDVENPADVPEKQEESSSEDADLPGRQGDEVTAEVSKAPAEKWPDRSEQAAGETQDRRAETPGLVENTARPEQRKPTALPPTDEPARQATDQPIESSETRQAETRTDSQAEARSVVEKGGAVPVSTIVRTLIAGTVEEQQSGTVTKSNAPVVDAKLAGVGPSETPPRDRTMQPVAGKQPTPQVQAVAAKPAHRPAAKIEPQKIAQEQRVESLAQQAIQASSANAPAATNHVTMTQPIAPHQTSMIAAQVRATDGKDLIAKTAEPEVQVFDLKTPGSSVQTASPSAKADLPRPVMTQLVEMARAAQDKPINVALNPEELGRVRMSVSTNDTGVILHIVAEKPETLDLMRRNIEEINREMAQAGFDELQLSFGQGQSADTNDDDTDGNRASRTVELETADDETGVQTASQQRGDHVAEGRLDLRL